MSNIKLIMSDLDGTLLKEDKTVSERALKALRDCHKQGIRFGISTGRSHVAVDRLIDSWHLRDLTDVIVAFNGAHIQYVDEGTSFPNHYLDKSKLAFVMDYLKGIDCNIILYDGGEIHAFREDEKTRAIEKRNRLKMIVSNLEEDHKKNQPKIVAVFPDAQTCDLFLIDHALNMDDLYMVRSAPILVEFLDPQVSKGQAIEQIASHYGLKPDEILTFGDEWNDVDMLEKFVGVAMGNALDEVKERASFTTLTNEEDGLADYLEKYVL